MTRKRKRPGDPWLLEYEERIVLRAISTLHEEWMAQFEPKFLPHPSLGPMFSAISQDVVVPYWGRDPCFRAQQLVDRWPTRFSSYLVLNRRDWSASRRPSIHLNSTLKRLSEKGVLRRRQVYGRRGRVAYGLPRAA